jgi:hypothetical protein
MLILCFNLHSKVLKGLFHCITVDTVFTPLYSEYELGTVAFSFYTPVN